jgi:hypothetical protein
MIGPMSREQRLMRRLVHQVGCEHQGMRTEYNSHDIDKRAAGGHQPKGP